MKTKSMLLAGIASALLLPTVARAEGPASNAASIAEAPTADAETVEDNEIVVLGFGESRQVQTIGAIDMERITPGSSPLKAISKLPGVNFQASDAFGAYEWSTRVTLRGFNQYQLGFTLDGVPLGDMSYGNVNGLHVSRAIISENIATTTVAQGAGALGTASTSNLGGTLQFVSRTPSDEADVVASGTYGADQTFRGFIRAESGDIADGLKGYLSYGFLKTDKWKGYGDQRQHQVNAKLVKDLGDQGSITGFVNFSDRRESDYQDLWLDLIRRRGLNNDNISDNYPLALQIARILRNQAAAGATPAQPLPFPADGTAFPAGIGTADDVYFDAAGVRRDWLGGMTVDAHLSPSVSIVSTAYYHNNKGQGSWITPYVATPTGAPGADGTPITNAAPLSFRTTEYGISRGGNLTRLAWEAGANRLEVGGWYESNTFDQARRYYGMANGTSPNRDAQQFQDNAFRTDWDGKYDTETLQYHVFDTLKLGDLTLNAGWKGMKVTNSASLRVGTLAAGTIEAKDWFLPQVGAVYAFGPAEVFVSYTENMRAFVSSATTGPFATTQAGFNGIRANLKPERSQTIEGGVRVRTGGLQLSAIGYYTKFADRLLSFQNGAGILGNPPTLNNAGDVESYGAELSAFYRVFQPLTVFASYSYNKSTYQDDVRDAVGTLLTATAGKTTVDSPEHMIKGEIVYDDTHFFARVSGDYMSKRYFTYLNDQSVDGRALFDASVGYRFGGEGFLDGFAIEASVTNLTDKKYVSTIGSNGFGASGDAQTLLAGAPRQWFVTLRRGF